MVTTARDRIVAALEAATGPGRHGSYRCPAHDDHTPSLTVGDRDDGAGVVMHCHAGCSNEDITAALGLTVGDLFDESKANGNDRQRRKVIDTYTYLDADGQPVGQVCRTSPKGFFQRRPDGRGGWINGGFTPTLYRAPEVAAAVADGATVIITEGEKDADALVAAGKVATTSPSGAGKFAKVTNAATLLAGAHVAVWLDDDPPGHAHGRDVIHALAGHVASWKVVKSHHGKDAAEHLGRRRDLLDGIEVLDTSEQPTGWLDEKPVDDDQVDDESPAPPALVFEDVATIAARVDAAPPPRYLARPVWVEDAYGVIGAEDKAGKSWAALDLAVAVAAGTRWLDRYPCEAPGPVTMFLGEGSDRKTIRRGRAVAEFHGATFDELPIRICHRAPKLTRADHLEAIHHELDQRPPRLVVLDPLYLSAGGSNSASLNEMGEVLGNLQHPCQAAGAALVVVHHWNQTGSGNDRKRFSGAGPAEWGRVLVSISVTNKSSTDGKDQDSIVDLTWKFIGDEIPDTTAKVTRRVWADDQNDLTSAMHYVIADQATPSHVIAVDDHESDREIAEAILDALEDGHELSGNKLILAVRDAGVSVNDRDVRRVAADLVEDGDLVMRLGTRNAQMFRLSARTEVEQ